MKQLLLALSLFLVSFSVADRLAPAAKTHAILSSSFGVVGDGQVYNDCSWTNGANPVVVTCNSAGDAGNGTCAATTGSTNEKGTVRITASTTTLLNPSFTLTFSGAGFSGATASAPDCTFQLSQTGTGSWVTTAPAAIGLPMITSSLTTAQTVGITTTVNLVSTSTYDVKYVCLSK